MCAQLAVTELLRQWQTGDKAAGDKLLAGIYEELQRIAQTYLAREGGTLTFESGDLINEALTRLIGEPLEWKDRGHFYALIARTMRRVLVDHARRHNRIKRGKDLARITLNEEIHGHNTGYSVLELDQALRELNQVDPRQSRIVELRFFAGLTIAEIAEVLTVSKRTVDTEWRMVKAWLFGRLQGAH